MLNTLGVFKALSDRNRMRTVMALMLTDELCACEIAEMLGVSAPTASRHMEVLIRSGLVASRKRGRWVHYRIVKEGKELKLLLELIRLQTIGDPDLHQDYEDVKNALGRSAAKALC